jgi:cell wall-associated NlpC family hydrolase
MPRRSLSRCFQLLILSMLGLVTSCHRLRQAEPQAAAGYARHAEPVDPAMATRGQHAAWFAQDRLGTPYCWGGTGPRCYDCSGLTHMAWKGAGKSIPRTSTAQHDRLVRVSMDRLAVGDILWRPGHVGIYVGNGWAIHAPGRGKPVQFQPANRFRQAVRP